MISKIKEEREEHLKQLRLKQQNQEQPCYYRRMTLIMDGKSRSIVLPKPYLTSLGLNSGSGMGFVKISREGNRIIIEKAK